MKRGKKTILSKHFIDRKERFSKLYTQYLF